MASDFALYREAGGFPAGGTNADMAAMQKYFFAQVQRRPPPSSHRAGNLPPTTYAFHHGDPRQQ